MVYVETVYRGETTLSGAQFLVEKEWMSKENLLLAGIVTFIFIALIIFLDSG